MWRRERREANEEDLAALRDLYAALGPGFPAAVRTVFLGEEASQAEEWCVSRAFRAPICFAAADLSNHKLFSMPLSWDLTQVELHTLEGELTKRGDRLKAVGLFFSRPRGSWRNERFPFLHLWTMCAGKALVFESYFDEFQLRRSGALEGCPPGSGPVPLGHPS